MIDSKMDSTCRKCSRSWKKGEQIHLFRVEKGSAEWNALSSEQLQMLGGNQWITCIDEECFLSQGGQPFMKSHTHTPNKIRKPEKQYDSATDNEVAEQQAVLDEHDRLERLAVYCLKKNGEEASGANVAFRVNTLATIKSYLPSVEIDKDVYSFREDNKLRTGVSSFPSLSTINEGMIGNKVMDNVKQLVHDHPTFFIGKKSGNQKIELYYNSVFGIDIGLLRKHSAEGITRAFRHFLGKWNPELKNYEKAEEYRQMYSKIEGTKDMSLLHD